MAGTKKKKSYIIRGNECNKSVSPKKPQKVILELLYTYIIQFICMQNMPKRRTLGRTSTLRTSFWLMVPEFKLAVG